MSLRRLFGFGEDKSQVEAEARRLLEEGQALQAGRLLEEHQLLDQAVDTYMAGGEYRAAADVLTRLGRRDEALAARRGASAPATPGRAAQVQKEAEALLQRGNTLDAARLFAQAGQWTRAADLYARAGFPLRAAEAYERAGDLRRAAESYERHAAEALAGGGGTRPEGRERQATLRGGQLFARLGQADRALALLVRGGHFAAAAESCVALGRFGEAAELYLRAEALDKAADAWERAGERARAALLRGELLLRAERPAEAAAQFLEGRDFYRAAELYESLARPGDAAAAYEAGGAMSEAGQAFLQAGQKARAAAAFERGHKPERAAELREELGELGPASALYERAERLFDAGRTAALSGDARRAISLLQRVEADDPRHAEAAERLAELFLDAGLPRLALERAQLVLDERPPSLATVGLHYWLARAKEALGDAPGALEVYRTILALDFAYRDAAARARGLEPVQAPPAPAPAPVAPAAAPPVAAASAPAIPRVAVEPGAAPRFTPRERIGQDSLGEVLRAEDAEGRGVALRVLRCETLDERVLRGLLGDVARARQLSHPNLAKVIALEEHFGRPCLVTELVKGTNMATFLERDQRLSVKRCHALGRALALALAYVHGKRLVHGALRPASVVVVSGIVKLADLGLGPVYRAALAPDAYRAPEDAFDVAGDVFALGATLYHLLTGCAPPRAHAAAPVLPPTPSDLVAGIPKSFDVLLLRALAPRPEARFKGARELVQAFDAMVSIN